MSKYRFLIYLLRFPIWRNIENICIKAQNRLIHIFYPLPIHLSPPLTFSTLYIYFLSPLKKYFYTLFDRKVYFQQSL